MGQERTIIVCLATSPHGVVVAREGVRFAEVLQARPVFLNVGPDIKDRRQMLEGIVREGGGIITEGSPLIREGEPHSVISAAAAELSPEMIIMGALGRDPAWVRVWGSVARKIARRAPCSVLLLSSSTSGRAGNRIVAGMALDGNSAAMMPMIMRIARAGACETIHFAHEYSEKSASVDEEIPSFRYTEEDRSAGRQRTEHRRLADFLSAFDLEGLDVRMAALPGREGMQVVEYARERRADLIILPAPPRRLTIWDRFFRHPLESVLMELPCALLMQRPSKNSTWVSAAPVEPKRAPR